MTYITKSKIKEFFVAAFFRALWTGAEVALALLPTTSFALGEVNWPIVLSTACGAMVVSMLKSIAIGIPEVEDGKSMPSIYAESEGAHARRGDE